MQVVSIIRVNGMDLKLHILDCDYSFHDNIDCVRSLFFQNFFWCYNISYKTKYISVHFQYNNFIFVKIWFEKNILFYYLLFSSRVRLEWVNLYLWRNNWIVTSCSLVIIYPLNVYCYPSKFFGRIRQQPVNYIYLQWKSIIMLNLMKKCNKFNLKV